jgi:hypothetical protein
VGADKTNADVGRRARQAIPPALRRTVLQRDHRCCRVPGCKNATFLDVHHIVPRAENGGNKPDNLVTLCGVHHRASHRGELVIEGGSAASIRFRHADGGAYGEIASLQTVATQTKVFAALRGLGFREKEVRAALATLCARPELRETTAERLLRAALAELTPGRAHSRRCQDCLGVAMSHHGSDRHTAVDGTRADSARSRHLSAD